MKNLIFLFSFLFTTSMAIAQETEICKIDVSELLGLFAEDLNSNKITQIAYSPLGKVSAIVTVGHGGRYLEVLIVTAWHENGNRKNETHMTIIDGRVESQKGGCPVIQDKINMTLKELQKK
jgi:hypothetical protein